MFLWIVVAVSAWSSSMAAETNSVPAPFRRSVQCMVEVLRTTPNVDQVESGSLKRDAQVPFVEYRYREQDGNVGKVRFVANEANASKATVSFVGFLSGSMGPGMTSPFLFGTREITKQWRLRCGVLADVILI